MLFKQWANKLAEKLCGVVGEKDSYQIALTSYRLESLFSGILNIIVFLTIAYLLNIVKTVLLISIVGVVVKAFAGGLHASTPLRCAIIGAILTVGYSCIAIYFPMNSFPLYLIWAALIIINIIVWMKAPHETAEKPLTGTQKKYLALFSKILVFVLSGICLVWPAGWGVNELFYGMVFSVINLLSISNKGMVFLDGLMGKFERKQVF